MQSHETTVTTAQQKLNSYWSIRSEPYDEFQHARDASDGYRAVWVDLFTDVLPPEPCDVLDVGTGSGYVAILLAELGHRVTATDLAEGMLERARQNSTHLLKAPRILHGDAVAPDFPEHSFDVVTNRYLMWTLREPEVALESWRRMLRPGGMIALIDSPWYKDGFDNTENEYFSQFYDSDVRHALPLAAATSIDDTRQLVEKAGFRDVTLTPLHALHEKSRELGLEPRSGGQLQFLITAKR